MVVYDKYYVKNKEKPQYVKKGKKILTTYFVKRKQLIKRLGSTLSK